MTKEYPPTFITDGNIYSFEDQGIEFSKTLESLDVPTTDLFYTDSTKEITHEYQFNYKTQEAKNCLLETLNFINEQIRIESAN